MTNSPALTLLQVNGMTCGGCEKAVVRAATAVSHVSAATADQKAHSVTIYWAPGLALEEQQQSLLKVCQAIDAAGFECQPAA